MTEKELKDHGWIAELCKIGVLYFKDQYFCRLTEDGKVIVYVTLDDMNPLGTAKTYDEIVAIEKVYEIKQIEKFASYTEFLKKKAIEKFGNLDL